MFQLKYLLSLQLNHINDVGQDLEESKLLYNELKYEQEQLRLKEVEKAKKEKVVEVKIIDQMKEAVNSSNSLSLIERLEIDSLTN